MVEAPLVIVNVMRGGPSTGLPTSPAQGDVQQARWGAHGDHPVIVLSASTVRECLEMTVTAFNFAEKFRTPVILLLDEITAHTRERIDLPDASAFEIISRVVPTVPPEWFKPFGDTLRGVPPMPPLGSGYRVHVTGLTHDPMGYPTERPDEIEPFVHRLFRKIDQCYTEVMLADEYLTKNADIVVVAYGSVARAAQLAVIQARKQGLKAGLVNLKTLFPFPRPVVERVARSCKCLVVPEMNMGQMSREIKRVNNGLTRIRTLNRVDGQIITPAQILSAIQHQA